MTFQQLSYLLEVAQTRSFSLAAKNLFVAQSTVSNSIAALEAELNCRIFVRSGQGLSLTDEGQQVLACAQRICENHQLLTSSAKTSPLRLRVDAVDYAPIRNAFLRILEEYRDRPEAQFSFGLGKDATFYDKLLLQQADIHVSVSFSPYDQHFMGIAAKKKLLCEKIAAFPVGICIGPGHPLYHTKGLKLEDFANHRIMDSPGREVVNTGALLAYFPINKENVLICKSNQLRLDILKKGLAYTIGRIPPKSQQTNGFRYIPIPGLTLTLAVFTDPIQPRTPLVDRYLELLREEVRKEL